MTLPTLIKNYQVKQWETALKRDYTVLTQGFKKIMADYGCDTLECTGIFTTTTDEEGNEIEDHDKLDTVFRSAFHVVNSYKWGEGEDRTVKYLKGDRYGTFDNKYYRIVLNDGAIVYIKQTSSYNEIKGIKDLAFISIDTNGNQLPNTLGKDVFGLGNLMSNGTIIPQTSKKWEEYSSNSSQYWRNAPGQCGTPNTKVKDETTALISGQNCLARIMENNWEMDYLK